LVSLPVSFPRVGDYGISIPPSQEVSINVHPEVSTADEYIAGFPIVRF